MVKTQKRYYIPNMRSAYFPINSRLHRERARERESKREREQEKREIESKRERDMKW